MLLLSRNKGEAVVIAETVRVIVTEIHQDFVDLIIRAPAGFWVEDHAQARIERPGSQLTLIKRQHISVFERPPRSWDPDDFVEIHVVQIVEDKTRLGFFAPKTMPIHREEVSR